MADYVPAMKHARPAIPLLVFAALVLALMSPAVAGESVRVGDLEIVSVWTRATPPAAQVGAAYATITNHGETPDRLIAIRSPMIGRGEVHEMSMVGGVMKMRAVAGGLEILPGGTVELKPGGFHVMLIGLAGPILEGKTLPLTFVFEKAGEVRLEPRAAPIGAAAPAD